jgi:hypothetical protein
MTFAKLPYEEHLVAFWQDRAGKVGRTPQFKRCVAPEPVEPILDSISPLRLARRVASYRRDTCFASCVNYRIGAVAKGP